MRVCPRLMAFVAGFIWFAAGAQAGCQFSSFQSVSPSTLQVGNYTATSVPPPTSIAVTITLNITGNGIGSCQGAVALYRAAPPAQMVRQPAAGVTLPYSITANGLPILYYGGGNPIYVPLSITNAPNGATSTTLTLLFTVTPQTPLSAPPSGNYLDQLMLQVFDKRGSGYVLSGQFPLTISAVSVGSCFLSVPSSLSLNFSSDIVTGIPAGAVQTTSFNVNCTDPSRLRLSGSALVMATTGSGSGAFDDLINYRAVANFGGALATLTTNGTSPVTIASPSASTLVGSNLPVSLNINLIPNRPLRSSPSYSGVLRVTVDPTL